MSLLKTPLEKAIEAAWDELGRASIALDHGRTGAAEVYTEKALRMLREINGKPVDGRM